MHHEESVTFRAHFFFLFHFLNGEARRAGSPEVEDAFVPLPTFNRHQAISRHYSTKSSQVMKTSIPIPIEAINQTTQDLMVAHQPNQLITLPAFCNCTQFFTHLFLHSVTHSNTRWVLTMYQELVPVACDENNYSCPIWLQNYNLISRRTKAFFKLTFLFILALFKILSNSSKTHTHVTPKVAPNLKNWEERT